MNTRKVLMLLACVAALGSGCASAPDPLADAGRLDGLMPTPVLLLGEQHDAPEHQALQRQTVERLAQQGVLAAVVLEMLEQGRQTTGLPRDADEARVRQALGWTDEANSGHWRWAVYGPVVMAAVRADVPVLGGNLPRERMRPAMSDTTLDSTLDPAALQQQRDAIREGHCGLLPEAQVAPMARIQIARDRTMADTARDAQRLGATVLLVAGNGHVRRDLGVPRHLPPDSPYRVIVSLAQTDQPVTAAEAQAADRVWRTPPQPPRDHCAELRQQMRR